MSKTVRSRAEALASGSLIVLGLILAQQAPARATETQTAAEAATASATTEKEVDAVVVTVAPGLAAQVAPVKSNLSATEPQAVITRKFIEESAPRVGDFTTTLSLAPSVTSIPNPNGPGSTDGGKMSLRGFQDGEFNITYDGIAWGDTNGPTHHANSFFPSSTIGGVVVDRGPGRASNIGLANFGGQVNLFSLPFEDRFSFRQTLTYGSWNTKQAVTTVAIGPVEQLHGASFVLNAMEYGTDGYLTYSKSDGYNQFIKGTIPVTDRFSVTALYTHNWDTYYQSDSSKGASVAQIEGYGRNFALWNDPRYQTYYKYNYTKKATEFGYVREDADFGSGLKLDNVSYTYWYSNKTQSTVNGAADNTLSASALTSANQVIINRPAAYPAGGSGYPASAKVTGMPGYLKFNWYRVYGDTAKFTQELGDVGTLSFGGSYEWSKTNRHRFYIDLLTGAADYSQNKAALFPGPSGCNGQYNFPVQVAPGKTYNGACQTPLNIGYLEYSGWRQYQLFAEFDWRPTAQLTITPGAKYVHYQVYVHAPVLAISGSLQPSYNDATYTKALPFLTANYRVAPDWAVYAQFAQGFLVPDITSFYVNQPGNNRVEPQQSTNYQLGTVYSRGKLTVDVDVYYIDFKHKIQQLTDLVTNETYSTNSGGATYKGVEGQATYVLVKGLSVFGNGSLNSAVGKDDPLNPGYNGRQLAKAPFWTGALGGRIETDGLIAPDDQIVATVNGKWVGPQFINAASGATPPTAKLHSFGQADFSITYRLDHFSLQLQVLNITDEQSLVNFKGKALIPGTNLPALTSAQGGAANQLAYQSPRSFQLTAKAAF